MGGSPIYRVGQLKTGSSGQNRGGVKKWGPGVKKSKKGSESEKRVKKWVLGSKRGSKKWFPGGGRKTHPLKVDRIYGETFSVVITGEVFLEVTFGVRKHEICHFLAKITSFLTFWPPPSFWPVDPHPKSWPPKTTPPTKTDPPKVTPVSRVK